MSERISPRFFPRRREVIDLHSRLLPLGAVLFAALYGCSSAGSSFGTGGSTGTSTGGGSVSSSGGSGTGSGGFSSTGSGGSPITGSGGGTTTGTGGDLGTGSGGTGVGSGGVGTSGSGGVIGAGTGGRTGSGTGGSGTGSGGVAAGSGGAPGSGGSMTTGTGGAVAAACPKGPGQICHEFLANDNARNQINYVNEFDTSKNWTKPVGDTGANSPRTIEIVDNAKAKTGKAILVSLEKGYGEFDVVDGALLARVSNKAGVSGACRLPDGTTALGNDNTILIVNAMGTEVRRIAIPIGDNLRAINRNPADGHFWFSKTSIIYEITDTGTIAWMGDMGIGTKGYAVWWRPGGGAWATTGDPSTVIEMDATGKILSTVGGKAKFAAVGLDFFSGFVRLPNGNFVVANWLGHLSAPAATTSEVVEFTPQNTIVWQWGNQTLARQITNVYVFR